MGSLVEHLISDVHAPGLPRESLDDFRSGFGEIWLSFTQLSVGTGSPSVIQT